MCTRLTIRMLVACLVTSGCAASTSSSDGSIGRSGESIVRVEGQFGVMTTDVSTDDQTQSGEIPADIDIVSSQIPALLEELGLEVGFVNDSQRTVGHAGARVRRIDGERLSNFLECGMGVTAQPYANLYSVTMAYEVQLRPGVSGSGTTVEMRIEGSAKARDVSAAPVRCTSKGTLEALVFEWLMMEVHD